MEALLTSLKMRTEEYSSVAVDSRKQLEAVDEMKERIKVVSESEFLSMSSFRSMNFSQRLVVSVMMTAYIPLHKIGGCSSENYS